MSGLHTPNIVLTSVIRTKRPKHNKLNNENKSRSNDIYQFDMYTLQSFKTQIMDLLLVVSAIWTLPKM